VVNDLAAATLEIEGDDPDIQLNPTTVKRRLPGYFSGTCKLASPHLLLDEPFFPLSKYRTFFTS